MELMNPREAAAYLRVSMATLAKWRTLRKGPSYTRTGKTVKYDKKALDSYLKKNVVTNQEA
jgi:excisionase family DNA binding protein